MILKLGTKVNTTSIIKQTIKHTIKTLFYYKEKLIEEKNPHCTFAISGLICKDATHLYANSQQLLLSIFCNKISVLHFSRHQL